MRKRNRAALLLVFPLAAIIWFVGWSLYWVGTRGKSAPPSAKPLDGITFTVLMPEQKYAT